MKGPIVIDLYCRMSFGHDGTVYKCEDQERQGREYLEGWAKEQDTDVQVGRVLYDHALSAWQPKVVRPSFNELMERLEAGKAHGVWVRDLDRFTRKVHEAERLVQVAKQGAHVLALRSNYDFTTARGIKRFREDAVDAAYESDRISERVKDGLRNKALRGKSLASTRGFARPGYAPKPEGWEPGDLRELVPAEQVTREVAAVRDAAARILAGEPLNSIAVKWNREGLLTTRGGYWDAGILRQMLEKPSLAGFIVHKGSVVGRQRNADPVLDEETFDRLQAHFASRRRGRPATEYLLSGIIRCGECGSVMYGRPLPLRPPYADGAVYREYKCQSRPNYPERCGQVTIDYRQADRLIGEAVVARLGDPRHADRLSRRAEKVESVRLQLLSELHRLDSDAEGIASKIVERGFAWVEAAMGPLDKRRAELHAELERLQAADTGRSALDLSLSWEEASFDQKRTMVRRAFPEGIYVSKGKSGRGRQREDDNDTEGRRRIHFASPFGSDKRSDREAS